MTPLLLQKVIFLTPSPTSKNVRMIMWKRSNLSFVFKLFVLLLTHDCAHFFRPLKNRDWKMVLVFFSLICKSSCPSRLSRGRRCSWRSSCCCCCCCCCRRHCHCDCCSCLCRCFCCCCSRILGSPFSSDNIWSPL